jgi:hypothetical protein
MALNPLGPVAGEFYLDNSEVACIMGPVGSGKTNAACLRIGRHIFEQRPDPDGVRRSRWVIVRNTGPQLRDTTIKTWLEVFPESVYGKLVGNPPRQIWNFKPRGSPYRIYAEILFRSLDDASDVANLLSLETTGFFFNELKLIAPEIIQHAGRRTGRAFGGGSTWHGWIADSNPWDFDSYHHQIFVLEQRPGYKFFKQPGGMDEDAENLENLEQTPETLMLPWNDLKRRIQGRQYYAKALRDYSSDEAAQYVHCKYGASRDGKPVFPSYNDSAHCQLTVVDPAYPLEIGYDCSGRNPAAIIGQHTRTGQWLIHREFVGEDVGMVEHAERCKRYIAVEFPGMLVGRITGDPAGAQRDSGDMDSFRIMRKAFSGVLVLPASTNDPRTRVEAVDGTFRRMINGEPAILINPACKILRAACTSKYQYRKLKLSGSTQYSEMPDKLHPWSDVSDALQYLMLGGGEGRVAMGVSGTEFSKPVTPNVMVWDVFGT